MCDEKSGAVIIINFTLSVLNIWHEAVKLYSCCSLTLFIFHFNPTYIPPFPPRPITLVTLFPAFQRIKHHNILQLVDAFETKKEYFLFMELWVLLEALERKCWCAPNFLDSYKADDLFNMWQVFFCILVINKWVPFHSDLLSPQCYRQRGFWLDLRSRVLLWEGHQQCYEAGVGSCSLPALSENCPQKS